MRFRCLYRVFVVFALLLAVAISEGMTSCLQSLPNVPRWRRCRSLCRPTQVGFRFAQQRDSLCAVGAWPPVNKKSQRFAELVTQQMNLGGQTSSGTPQSLVRAPFLRPVAAC